MSTGPLTTVGRLQAAEAAIEVVVPLVVCGGAWWVARRFLAEAVAGASLTPLEVNTLLAACIALTSWAIGRQFYLAGRRSPLVAVAWSVGLTAALLVGLPLLAAHDFESACTEAGGSLAKGWALAEGPATVCRIGGVAGNHYLQGVVLRPAWDARLSAVQWLGLLGFAVVATMALRTARLRGSRVPLQVIESLRFAPAAGTGAVLGDPSAKNGRVQACANATLWGEICGQMYAAERQFEPGEWCMRCNQPFRAVDRELDLSIVSLFSGDVDVLNGLERVDTVSWAQGEPMPPDARISAQERWVRLGRLSVPDVLTVAQVLALVHEQLELWAGGEDASRQRAATLAKERASRIAAWFWKGSVQARLTYARPTPSAILGIGPVRLRDLDLDGGDELSLQLDIGLLPLELRVGFRKTFLDANRSPEVQNSKQTVWIPVGPPGALEAGAGLWVPRLEGQALRVWLATERARAESVRGVSSPMPYSPTGLAPGDPTGPLDLERRPQEGEDDAPAQVIGASISEWKWFEAEQIELLRRDVLVLVAPARSA